MRGILLLLLLVCHGVWAKYYGKFIGRMETLQHGVSGIVYAATEDSLYLVNFTYDGSGPDAFFWAGSTPEPDAAGEILADENGRRERLRRYNHENVVIKLDKPIRNYRYLAVYCRRYEVNFGWVRIPHDFEPPAPQDLGFLSGGHGIAADPVVLLDSRTVQLTNFHYDGGAPDAHFLVGRGEVSGASGIIIADEKGSLGKLGRYAGQNVTLSLHQGASWDQYEWLSIYCIKASQDFAHIRIPDKLSVPLAQEVTPYFGKLLGNLNTGIHGVGGKLYVASADTLVLQDFTYDGMGPDAHFLIGTTDKADGSGTVIDNQADSATPLSAYSKSTFELKLPAGKKITDYRWFSVYCKKAQTSFAHVDIPSNVDYPRPAIVAAHISGAHNTRAEAIVVHDKRTLVLKNFYYDGSAPDAFFLAGKGESPRADGTKIPDETGRVRKLAGYVNATVRLTLPGNLTVDDIDWFAVYCITYTETFIQAKVPKGLNVPPNIKLLLKESSMQAKQRPGDFANCEAIIPNRIQVGWHLQTDTITFHVRAQTVPGQWTAFGVSGVKERSAMVGADVAVIFVRRDHSHVSVSDYYLSSKAQCSSNGGVCPDTRVGGTEDLQLVSARYENGVVDVIYSRKLATADSNDKIIAPTGRVAVVAAQGPTNMDQPDTVLYHTMVVTRDDTFLQFNRNAERHCPPLAPVLPAPAEGRAVFGGRNIWKNFNVTTFRAQIGPTGGSRGYEKVTGQSGWGISWWINEELIPVLHVERGKTYTFVVEGGLDPSNSARYHPFYITDSSKGGGSKEDPAVLGKPGHLLLAGVVLDSENKVDVSNGTGRYCEWQHKTVDMSDESDTWESFKQTLRLQCDSGQPGTFTWTPDKDTPRLVYYQCFTHYYLGWKIVVTDPEEAEQAMQPMESAASPVLLSHLLLFSLAYLMSFC
uniref:Chitin-binding protein n=1 Tax=Rhipicephalus appendiculatus TaxID=34631 RepID=A0A131YTZ5_RHIAP